MQEILINLHTQEGDGGILPEFRGEGLHCPHACGSVASVHHEGAASRLAVLDFLSVPLAQSYNTLDGELLKVCTRSHC